MTADERSRLQLHQRLQEVLGADKAATLMEHLPVAGTATLATKDDIRVLEHKLDAVEQRLRAEMHGMGRSLLIPIATIVAVLNGIIFAALKLG